MSILDRINDKSTKYAESGLEIPDFVFLSKDVYIQLLNELHPSVRLGTGTIQVLTAYARLDVKVSSSLPANSIIVGDHAIITILRKLKGIICK